MSTVAALISIDNIIIKLILTFSCCCRLWKSDECCGGSSVGGICHGVIDGTEGGLSNDGVVVLCCCCVCHGAMCECAASQKTESGGVRLTRVSLSHFFHSIIKNHYQQSTHENTSKYV